MKIGDRIKHFRKEKGLTQVTLAEKANMSRSYLADIENNRYNPSIDVVNSIASALGISVDKFFKETVSEKKDSTINEINKMVKDSGINTIAAHFEGEEFSEADKEDIENFIKYILSKKKK